MPSLQPNLSIHCWGGLGSQMYAWALAEGLRLRFPSRKLKLICHSSGVTKRHSEIHFVRHKFQVLQKDDFVGWNSADLSSETSHQSRIQVVRKLLGRLLDLSGFVIVDDGRNIVERVRPWTFQIRGHYSTQQLTLEVLNAMSATSTELGQVLSNSNHIEKYVPFSFHYRLGDLVELHSKSPIHHLRIQGVISHINRDSNRDTEWLVSSDSPAIASSFLADSFPDLPINILELDAWRTVLRFINSRVFVGTNSKLSLWIAIFMLNRPFATQVYLPREIRHHLDSNITNLSSIKNLNFY